MIAVFAIRKIGFETQGLDLHQETVTAQERFDNTRSSTRDIVDADQSTLSDGLLVKADIHLEIGHGVEWCISMVIKVRSIDDKLN